MFSTYSTSQAVNLMVVDSGHGQKRTVKCKIILASKYFVCFCNFEASYFDRGSSFKDKNCREGGAGGEK